MTTKQSLVGTLTFVAGGLIPLKGGLWAYFLIIFALFRTF